MWQTFQWGSNNTFLYLTSEWTLLCLDVLALFVQGYWYIYQFLILVNGICSYDLLVLEIIKHLHVFPVSSHWRSNQRYLRLSINILCGKFLVFRLVKVSCSKEFWAVHMITSILFLHKLGWFMFSGFILILCYLLIWGMKSLMNL